MGERMLVALAVYLVLFDDEGRVLMLRRAGTGWQDGNFSLAAGHVEPGEGAIASMIREAEEEIGVTLTADELSHAHTMYRADGTNYIDLYFTARSWVGTPEVREPDKADLLAWFHPDDLPDDIVPVVRQALQHIARGSAYSEDSWD